VVKGLTGVGVTAKDRQKVIELDNAYQTDRNVTLAIAGCHSLAFADGAIVGDPLER
jgi:hypothetical protein